MAFEPLKLKLTNPLRTHKGEVNELTLNRVTAGVLSKHGQPYRTVTITNKDRSQRSYEEFDYNSVLGIAVESTGIDRILLDTIDSSDLLKLSNMILELLVPVPNVSAIQETP